jgi:hypothetical protein
VVFENRGINYRTKLSVFLFIISPLNSSPIPNPIKLRNCGIASLSKNAVAL